MFHVNLHFTVQSLELREFRSIDISWQAYMVPCTLLLTFVKLSTMCGSRVMSCKKVRLQRYCPANSKKGHY
jgi:hypothetical protein